MRQRRLQLNFCVMRQNWHEAGDFFLFAEDLGCMVWKVFVTNPAGCSLFTLPPGDLEPIVAALEARSDEMEKRLTLNHDVWFAMVEEVRNHLNDPPVNLFDSLTRGTGDTSSVLRGSPGKLVRAWQLKAQGRFEEAIRQVESITEDDTYYYRAKCALGEFKIGLGDYDGAERELDEALALTGKRPEVHLIRAWLRVTEGKMNEAVAAGRQAAGAVAQLREVEAKFVEEVLLQRLTQHDALAAVLVDGSERRGW